MRQFPNVFVIKSEPLVCSLGPLPHPAENAGAAATPGEPGCGEVTRKQR
jgi:hypothetical protein